MNAFQTNEPPLIRIVDDEERMRESLAFMLRQEGFECAMYPSAEAFLREDSPSRPGCLLLDVQMDGMTGLELQEEMNRRGMTLPIVFLSAHGDLDMAVDTMRRGAAAFIQKTADRARLMEAIVSAVERSSPRRRTRAKKSRAGRASRTASARWLNSLPRGFSTARWASASGAYP